LITNLRAAHYNGEQDAGIDITNGTVANVRAMGIIESYKVKFQILITAAEAAEMILRVDEIIKSAPRKRESHRGNC